MSSFGYGRGMPRADPRVESWQRDLTSIRAETFLMPRVDRRRFVDPYITDSMCDVSLTSATTPTSAAKISQCLSEFPAGHPWR